MAGIYPSIKKKSIESKTTKAKGDSCFDMAVVQTAAGLFLAVPPVMQTGECLLSFSKQSNTNTALAVLPADAMVLQHSPEPWHRSAFLQETSACPASICHPQPDQCCVSGRALPSCLNPPDEGRSFPRLSLPCEINGQCGTDAVLLADWDGDPSLFYSLRHFSSHIWRHQCCLGFSGQGWCLLKIAVSCLTQVDRCPFRK